MGQYQGEDYISDYDGPEIDKGVGSALNPDAAPTADSDNLVTSGGVYTAIQNIQIGVTSFNGRTGAVFPAAGDYDAAMVGATPVFGKGVNLLDNWYFVGGGSQQGGGQFPINQRGETSYTSAGYGIDRWKLVSGTVTLTAAGIVLNGTMEQIRETAIGQPVTASALTTTGIVTPAYDDATKTLTLTGTGQTFIAAKLELGSTQTLAHQDENENWVLNEVPNFQQELAKCQRYFYAFNTHGTAYARFGIGPANSTTQARIVAPLPVTMRTTPTFSITGAFTLSDGANAFDITTTYLDSGANTDFAIFRTSSNGLTASRTYVIEAKNDPTARIYLSADL